MSKPCVLALGLTLGAVASPLGIYLGARLSGRHWLDLKEI